MKGVASMEKILPKHQVYNMIENKNFGDVTKVSVYDYSDYDPDLCNNGGRYGYTVNYERSPEGWTVSHSTTADFDYCPVCGSFNNHRYYNEDTDLYEYSCGDFEVLSDYDVIKMLTSLNPDGDEYDIYISSEE